MLEKYGAGIKALLDQIKSKPQEPSSIPQESSAPAPSFRRLKEVLETTEPEQAPAAPAQVSSPGLRRFNLTPEVSEQPAVQPVQPTEAPVQSPPAQPQAGGLRRFNLTPSAPEKPGTPAATPISLVPSVPTIPVQQKPAVFDPVSFLKDNDEDSLVKELNLKTDSQLRDISLQNNFRNESDLKKSTRNGLIADIVWLSAQKLRRAPIDYTPIRKQKQHSYEWFKKEPLAPTSSEFKKPSLSSKWKQLQLKQAFDVYRVEGAIDFLESISSTNNEVKGAVQAFENIQRQLSIVDHPKATAKLFGIAQGRLKVLIERPGIFSEEDNTDGITASKTLLLYLQKKLDAFIMESDISPKEILDIVGYQIAGQSQQKKERVPQQILSQYAKPEDKFIRKRMHSIFLNDRSITNEKAEHAAREELQRILSLLESDSEYVQMDNNQKKEALDFFITQVHTGGSIEEAWDIVKKRLKRIRTGTVSANALFKTVNIESEDFDGVTIDDILSDLTDPEIVQANIGDLSEKEVSELSSKILKFGDAAYKFFHIAANIEESTEGFAVRETNPENIRKAEQYWEMVSSIGEDIIQTDIDQITSSETSVEFFQQIYWTLRQLGKMATSILGEDNADISRMKTPGVAFEGSEAKGFGVIDPLKKGPRTGKHLKRNKEVEEAARQAYETKYRKERLLAKRLHEQNKPPNEKAFSTEMNRIRAPFNETIRSRIIPEWKNTLTQPEASTKIERLIKAQQHAINELFHRIKESWLEDVPGKYEDYTSSDGTEYRFRFNGNEVIDSRIIQMSLKYTQDAFSKLLEEAMHTQGSNPSVVSAIQDQLNKLPEQFNETREKTKDISIPKFAPGERSRGTDKRKVERFKVRSHDILYMADLFMKFAIAE